jgi:hypothetical protein
MFLYRISSTPQSWMFILLSSITNAKLVHLSDGPTRRQATIRYFVFPWVDCNSFLPIRTVLDIARNIGRAQLHCSLELISSYTKLGNAPIR